MNCETCNKDPKDVWAFRTSDRKKEYDFCSEECANKKIEELKSKGYKVVGEVIDNGN